MLRRWMIVLCLLLFGLSLVAQQVEQLDDENSTEGIVQVNYQKKSVGTAMLLSALFPGAGQYYANPRAVTTYIFPVIEIGLWVGYLSFDAKGSDKEDEYMKYADANYNRAYQANAETSIMGICNDDIYDDTHFRLDDSNSQHFYEDIGKYDKYIYGWTDWHNKYGYNDSYNWAWDTTADDSSHVWVGNYPTNPEYADETSYSMDSPLRDEYMTMRKDAEHFYDKAEFFSFGIVFNHIISVIDAVRVTRAYNVDYISKRPVDVNIRTCSRSGKLTPMLNVAARF